MRFRAPVLTIACLTVGMVPLVRTGTARAAEALIAVDVPAAGCPGRADVVSALEARLPGVTRGRGGSGSARYRLEVNHAAGEAEVPLRLRSLAGGVVLERRLPVEARARPSELCQALAEAAALVVVRYLRDLGYRPDPTPAPPDEPLPDVPAAAATPTPPLPATTSPPVTAASPPPAPPAAAPSAAAAPPPAAVATQAAPTPGVVSRSALGPTAGYLGAGAVVRLGLRGDLAEATRGEIAASLQTSGAWWHLEVGGGASSETRVEVGGATAGELRLRAFPLRAAFGIPLGLGGGQLIPLAGVTLDLTSFRATGLADARSGLRAEPAAELGVGYRRAGPSWFWRAQAGAGFSLRPRDFAAEGQEPAYRSPAAYLRALVEVGPVLWKN
jgi:hypothetical protein